MSENTGSLGRRELLRLAAAATAGWTAGDVAAAAGRPASIPLGPVPAGMIAGRAMYDGVPPEPETIDCSVDPYCANLYRKEPLKREFVVVSPQRELRNVFVSIARGLPEGKDWPVPAKPVVLSEDCRYDPHVFGVMAGQPLELLNASRTHEVPHGYPKKNQEFSFSLRKHGMRERVILEYPEYFKIKCDVHPWELACCHVVDHPFFAVTDERGRFVIRGLPEGEYEVTLWHEQLGVQTQRVALVAGKGSRLADAAFKPKKKRRPTTRPT